MYSVFLFAGSKAHDGQSKRALHRWTKACSAWSWTQAPSGEACGPQTIDETCRYSQSCKLLCQHVHSHFIVSKYIILIPRAVIKRGGWGFPQATMNVTPSYFYWKIEEKQNQKKPLAVWFPTYLLYLPSNLESW